MLLLSRKPSQEIVIYTTGGLKITVAVLAICGNHVRLGVTAPDHVHIDREEIYRRKQAEKSAV